VPVGGPQAPHGCGHRAVAVLDPFRSLLRRAVAGVQTDQRLTAHLAAIGQEFVGAEKVVLERLPGGVGQGGAGVHRTDARSPAIAGNKVAPWPTQERQTGRLELGQDLGIEMLHVIGGVKQQPIDHQVGRSLGGDGEAEGALWIELGVRCDIQAALNGLPLGADGEAGRSDGRTAGSLLRGGGQLELQLHRVRGACHQTVLVTTRAMDGQPGPLCEPPGSARPQQFHALGAPAVWAHIGAHAHLLAGAQAEPPVSQAILVFLGQRASAGGGPPIGQAEPSHAHRGELRDAQRVALRLHAAVGAIRPAIEHPAGKGGVGENLSLHPLIDVGAQMLAELAKEQGRDGPRGALRGIDGDRGAALSALGRDGDAAEQVCICGHGATSRVEISGAVPVAYRAAWPCQRERTAGGRVEVEGWRVEVEG